MVREEQLEMSGCLKDLVSLISLVKVIFEKK